MAKTLLKMTQDILSDIDGDEVNSIDDTIESQQISRAIVDMFDFIVSDQELPSIKQTFQLEAYGDTDKPTHFDIPADVNTIDVLRYNTADDGERETFVKVYYLEPVDFLRQTKNRNVLDTNVISVEVEDNVTVNIRNDVSPTYWTTFDNETIIFDSFDENISSTMTASNTEAYGQRPPTLSRVDGAFINLPNNLLPYLQAEVREYAFDVWRGGATPKIQQLARKGRVRQQRSRDKLRRNVKLPNYGRKSIGGITVGSVDSGYAKPLPDHLK